MPRAISVGDLGVIFAPLIGILDLQADGGTRCQALEVPERILTRSASRRWVVNLLVPGLRASRNGWMAVSASGSPGGHPSTTAPSAGPWLSPQVVIRSTRPKVFTLMG